MKRTPMEMCPHPDGIPSYDLWHCKDCGQVKTDSGWGIARNMWFQSRAEAEFYRQHGRLPDSLTPTLPP